MSWAEGMRTHVVHRGDFEANSVARVSVLAAWDSPPSREVAVSPLRGPRAIAEVVRRTAPIPRELLKDAVAIVERRWVVNSLPSREVLEGLADCYVFLHELVSEAHERCGFQMSADNIESVRPTWTAGQERRDRPSEMVQSEEFRTSRLQVWTGESIEIEHGYLQPNEEDMKRAEKRWAERYGGLPDGYPGKTPEASDDLFALAEWHVAAAKGILAGDGYHLHLVWSFGPEGVHGEVFRPEDRTEKYLLWNRLAERMTRRKDWAVLSVGEVWTARIEPGLDPTRIRDLTNYPKRGEALLIAAAHRDGKARSFTVPFERTPAGKITFGKVSPGYAPSEAMNFFIPIMKVWQAWRRTQSGYATEPLFVDSRPTDDAQRRK